MTSDIDLTGKTILIVTVGTEGKHYAEPVKDRLEFHKAKVMFANYDDTAIASTGADVVFIHHPALHEKICFDACLKTAQTLKGKKPVIVLDTQSNETAFVALRQNGVNVLAPDSSAGHIASAVSDAVKYRNRPARHSKS